MIRKLLSLPAWCLRQLRDLLIYFLLPLLCFLLPVRWAERLQFHLAGSSWFFRGLTRAAWTNALEFGVQMPEADWKRQYRLMHLLDAVDLWHGLFSSDRRIRERLVTVSGNWPDPAQGAVFLGTHLGVGTLLMRVLAAAGFAPRLIYRGELDRAHLGPTPVLYYYMKLRLYYMIRVCKGQAIRVGGAGLKLRDSMNQAHVGVIMVADSPLGAEVPDRLPVLGKFLPVPRRGLDMLAQAQATFVPYNMVWDPARRQRVLELLPADRETDPEQMFARYAEHATDALARYGPQWRLWQVAHQVLVAANPVPEKS